MKELIPYDTAAKTEDYEFSYDVPSSLQLDVDGSDMGTDTIPVYYVGLDGTRQTPVLDEDGNAFEFSASRKSMAIHAPCKIRVVKGITTNAVGINICGRI